MTAQQQLASLGAVAELQKPLEESASAIDGSPSDRASNRTSSPSSSSPSLSVADEIEKLATWASGDAISARDVEQLAVSNREVAPWALSDAWGARDVGAVLTACESELGAKEPFVLAARLASHVALIRSVRRLAQEGIGSRELAKRLDVHEFRARKALAQSENYSPDELDRALVRLADLDAALKGASRLSGDLELERELVEITPPTAVPAPA
jgi:DNA polymerase III subunit delta